MTLGEFETGARVIKTNAIRFDAAYGCIGTVHREGDMVGVEWDLWPNHIVQYVPNFEGFEPAPKGLEK